MGVNLELLAVLVTMVGVGIALSVQVRSTGRRLDDRMNRIESEVSGLGKEVAHLSGLVEGLREAIAHNRAA